MKQSAIYICHYSEIGLKGKNRNFFVKILKSNMKRALKRALPGAIFRIEHIEKRYLLIFETLQDVQQVYRVLGHVFGLANFSAVAEVAPDIPAMQQKTLELLQDKSYETFVIRSRRVHKSLPFNSMEVNQQIGAAVVEMYEKKVDLKRADLTCNIEIFKDKAFVSVDKNSGPGGMPVGSAGRVLVLMSGGFDSPVAAYYAMKRGARADFIHFHTYPFTNKASQDKVKQLVQILNKYQQKATLFMVPFTETQQEIVMAVPEGYRIIFYRRFMMRIAERLAQNRDTLALITGESLGQVASQTLENIGVVEEVVTLPVLRPLIGLDKNEIMDVAHRIGTYETSVLPHDDACVRFMPKNPVIRAKIDEVRQIEKALDVPKLVEQNLEKMELIEL